MADNRGMCRLVRVAAVSCLIGLHGMLSLDATAAEQATPAAPWMSLSATASADAEVDRMTVRLRVTRDGAEPGEVQRALQRELGLALQRTAGAVRPGDVEVHTGNVALAPRRGPRGDLVGWTGTADLVIEGSDLAAVALLAGRTAELAVTHVGYGLSPARRAQAQARASDEAIANFRAQATASAQAFGYGRYALHDVDVSADHALAAPMQALYARAQATDAEPLPTQPGHATVTVTVRGTVELLP